MASVAVQIVTYQSLRFLPFLLNSLKEQTFKEFSWLIIDNGSTDGTMSYLKECWPNVPVFQNRKNFGYAKANNQGIKLSTSPYILILNPDIILDKNFIKEMMKTMVKYKNAGAVGGKLLKARFKDSFSGKFPEFSQIIDSCGLEISKGLRFFDRGQGEIDNGQYNKEKKVFGINGAAVIYKREALEDIKYKGEYFDEDFFAYKEDIDLAWRLKNKGWSSFYNPYALAYHFRKIGAEQGNKKLFFIPKDQFNKSALINFLSFRNHLWLIVKNCPKKLFFYEFPYFFLFQAIKFFWLLIQSPLSAIKGFFSFFIYLPEMFEKRNKILNKK